MIVWGGVYGTGYPKTGGVYDPATDTWTATSTVGAPSGRNHPTAVWTGSKMIVWGGWGVSGPVDTGGMYDPVTDTWQATSTVGAPTIRYGHTAVWTGSKMVVWGGSSDNPRNTGGIYDPETDTWTATSTVGAPSARTDHKAVWTGSKMIVWGGNDKVYYLPSGGIYDPQTNTWTATSLLGTSADNNLSRAVWTGSRMIVWGGDDGMGTVNTGKIYNPTANTWGATSTVGAPQGRYGHTAVWTGSGMAVWGGFSSSPSGELNTGGIYDPTTNTWTATTTVGAPSAREDHTAVWTGSRMLVWGGIDYFTDTYYDTGGLYAPDQPPVLDPIGDRSVNEGETLSFTVSATDPDGDPLTYSSFNLPAGATFDPPTRTFSWTPGYDRAGSYPNVTFRVSDGTLADSEAITINVFDVNRAPVLDPIGDKQAEEAVKLTFTVSGHDPDGDPLVYNASNLPAGAAFDPVTRIFSWTPGLDQAGTYPGILFTVEDWTTADSESITITVADNPTPPGFFTVNPCRVLDTRDPAGPYGGPALVSGAERAFTIAGRCNIPSSAAAVSVNLTVTQPSAPGSLRLYPADATRPLVSTINYAAGQTRANNAIVPVDALGGLAVYCAQASGTVHFILDVNGYFQTVQSQ